MLDNLPLSLSNVLELTSASASQSPGNTKSEAIGERLIDVIKQSYNNPFTIQSEYFRSNAIYVAAAASLGLITTLCMDGLVTNQWRPTGKGFDYVMRNI